MEMNFSHASFDFFLMLSLISIFMLVVVTLIRRRASPPIPPGPYQWPVIGNFLQMRKDPHIKLSDMARTYGPIMSFRLGSRLVVVGSTPKAAMEILKTHDLYLSARHVSCTHPASSPEFNKYAVSFAKECNDEWKRMRSICRAGLFRTGSLQAQVKIHERNVRNMVKFLHARVGYVVDMSDLICNMVLNIMSNILFSRDVFWYELDEEGPALEMKKLSKKFINVLAAPNMGDLFPMLHGWDIQGMQKKARYVFDDFFAIWHQVIKERREMRSRGISSREDNFLDTLLDNGFTDEHINHLMLELLLAGTDTTTTTIIWALADLVKHGHAMHKLRSEIETNIGDRIISESDAMYLPFLQACIKETMRLHPPVPFLLPHRAIKTCEVMNFRIPKDSQVIVNTWAMSRDPNMWEDPSSFIPERFIESSVDFKGNDFEFVPFGSGRRMCPGLPMAALLVPYVVASLVHSFNWLLPGYKNPSDLDMEEVYLLALRKKQPLQLIPRVAKRRIEMKKIIG